MEQKAAESEKELELLEKEHQSFKHIATKKLGEKEAQHEGIMREEKTLLSKKEQSLKLIEQELKTKVENAKKREQALHLLEEQLLEKSKQMEKEASTHQAVMETRAGEIIRKKEDYDQAKADQERRLEKLEIELRERKAELD